MRAIAQDDNEDVWVRRENVEGQPTNEVHNPLRGKKKEIMEAILVKSFSLFSPTAAIYKYICTIFIFLVTYV